jgi:23S rRNA pseudouridine1911/1915/1917 synthase
LSLSVIFEDNHLLVVNKQAGTPVQGDETGDTPLTQIVEDYLRVTYKKPGNIYVGLVHRIDRPVSGLVLFAKTGKAAARLSEMLQTRKIQKTYFAITDKQPPHASGHLSDFLWKDAKNNKVYCYVKEKAGSKKAELTYKVIEHVNGFYLLEVNPLTGRSHQIRVQLANMGCPILGDTKYGSRLPLNDRSICLLARKLVFEHPVKKEIVTFYSNTPTSKYWQLFAAQFEV